MMRFLRTLANLGIQKLSKFQCIRPEEDSKDSSDFVFDKSQGENTRTISDCDKAEYLEIPLNCKETQSFTLCDTSLTAEFLFEGMRNITDLSLRNCGQLNLKAMEAITASLIHLETLDLYGTKVVQDGLYILCGHKFPFTDFSPARCCYTGSCEIVSPLRLQRVNVDGCVRQETEIACLLTHIPTLKVLDPQKSVSHRARAITSLARTICQIIASRAAYGMFSLQFEIENINMKFDDVVNWSLLFQHCKRLKYLEIVLEDENSTFNPYLVDALANNDLQCLERLNITFDDPRNLMTDSFELFWKMKGHQLTELSLKQSCRTSFSFCICVFNDIISLCPSLSDLTVYALLSREAGMSARLSKLSKCRNLNLFLRGDGNKAHIFCCKILLSCKEITACRLMLPSATDGKLSKKLQNLARKCREVKIMSENFRYE